ncbi:MAG: hypothetical protein QOD84_2081 [Acidobacteriaceae bacterium]|jgi:hypothetical protein
MTVGSVKQGVNVTAASEVLHTTDASVGEVIEPQSIRELPLNGVSILHCERRPPYGTPAFPPE